MNKHLEKIKYVEFRYNCLNETNYDNLFEKRILSRGKQYYQNDKIKNLNNKNNKYFAIVSGTYEYNVSITIEKETISVSCECPYHKDTNKYCKHIYAVLLKIHNDPIKNEMKQLYNSNTLKLEDILIKVKKLIKENDKYFAKKFSKDLAISRQNEIKRNIETLKNNFNLENDWQLTCATNLSFIYLNKAIENYNDIIDNIEYKKKTIKEKKTISVTYTIDNDEIFNAIDNKLVNIPSEKLEKARTELIKNNEDTEIIDKAIKNGKTHKKQIKKRKTNTLFKTLDTISYIILFPIKIFFAIVCGLREGSTQSNNNSLEKEMNNYGLEEWQKDLVRKGNYNPWNFEEEELEEDDYYYDNLD